MKKNTPGTLDLSREKTSALNKFKVPVLSTIHLQISIYAIITKKEVDDECYQERVSSKLYL